MSWTVVLKEEIADSVRFFDVEWEDSQNKVKALFTEHLLPYCTIEHIVRICDSNRSKVQTFGQELLCLELFGSEKTTDIDFSTPTKDGKEYLLRLSQHPYADVEGFTAKMLGQYLSGDLDTLDALRPYFKRVLSRVRTNRPLKQDIMSLIQKEALASKAGASLLLNDIYWLAASHSIQDKAFAIELLVDIKRHFPDLSDQRGFGISKVSKNSK